MTICAVVASVYILLKPEPQNHVVPHGWTLRATEDLPEGLIYWFTDENDDIVTGLLIFGDHPTVMISGQHGAYSIPDLGMRDRISLPRDGAIYILSPSNSLVQSKLDLLDTVKNWRDYSSWGKGIRDEIDANTWNFTNTEQKAESRNAE